MYNTLLNEYIRFRHTDDGATLVEYGIALTLAVTLGTGALLALSGDVGATMDAAGNALPVQTAVGG